MTIAGHSKLGAAASIKAAWWGMHLASLLTHLLIITGSIARSAKRRYLSYSEADFEVATRCTDGDEIWHRGGDRPSYIQKMKFLLNINAPQGHIPCAIFTKFAEFVPHLRMP